MSDRIVIDRPPRIQPELPIAEIEIPKPPDKTQHGIDQLIQMGLPLLMVVSFIVVSGLGGGRNALIMIPMALAVFASMGYSIYSYLKEKRRLATLERDYTARLTEMTRDMQTYHDMQRRFYYYNYPDVEQTLGLVRSARREAEKSHRTLRAETRLWERRVTDDDFGVVRLGIGTLPSTVVYTLDQADNTDDPQMREALKLARDSQFVSEIPVIISLRQQQEEKQPSTDKEQEGEEQADEEESRRTPVTHALGIAGERTAVYHYARAMLTQYVIFHAPMDARLYVLAARETEWAWTEALPHCQEDEQNQYRFFAEEHKTRESGSGTSGVEEEGALSRFLEGLRRTLAQRKLQLHSQDDETKEQGDPTLPHLLVVVDLMDVVYNKQSPLSHMESDAAISILVEEGASLGAAVVFLTPERSKVPSGCLSVVELERTTPVTSLRGQQQQELYFRYAEVGVNTFRYVGTADYVDMPDTMKAFARDLAQLEVQRGYGAGLATTVPFLDLFSYASLDDLAQDAVHRWTTSTDPRSADWLRAKIGRMSGNKPRTLVFSAKRDGVHGMIAGSTGSGKSELLISLITAMSVTYDPSVLNFVLVDYKGGGAFQGFENLPHCVDIITNLDGDGVTRMFAAINAEMQRRQKLNTDTNTKNIVDYRKKGLHLTHAPYPFLFIIVDEFAEMIADRSEFKTQLESITRVGRAQGVSLLLAAQRPSGVTDQMRSNIKFRICLRVETPGESREMLRRSDAAFLPGSVPGRGYLQVGNDEIELIQSAYTGDKYREPSSGSQAPVVWPDRGGTYNATLDHEPPPLFLAIVDRLARVAEARNTPKQYAPWPDFLPTHLTLSEPLFSDDPRFPTVTAERYLKLIERITLGQTYERPLTLSPFFNRWLDEEGDVGWVSRPDWKRYAMRPVVGLIDDPFGARQLPLTVDLPSGHVAVFGASGCGKTTFLRTLIVSLASVYAPDQLRMYLLDLGGHNLSVLGKSLPHVGAVIIPDEEGYHEQVEQLLRELDDLIDRRKTILGPSGAGDVYEYNQNHPATPLPITLVAIDNFTEFREAFEKSQDNIESVMDRFTALARQAKSFGIHLVITANQLNAVPNQLLNLFTERIALKLADPTEYRVIVGGTAADINNTPGRGYVKVGSQVLACQVALPFDPRRGQTFNADGSEADELTRLGKAMNEYVLRSGRQFPEPLRVGALPKTILYKQILTREYGARYGLTPDETFMTCLKDIARQQWTTSRHPDHADWLRATIGVVSGDRLREMHLEAKDDGVHGLIAGGTGSGKSELLMTLIVDLALRYDPSILNFVLVDYKGGGAFLPFTDLPHCVDTITNLNKAAVRRMFTAISAEMQRRQRLNAETGTKDIVEYRAKGLHLTHQPYPHLFIIIDEYAEMISDSPEFKNELDSITRVGRAQGVNLLLAAQRPTGVTDQMRANIKFRICLRVEQVDTSREMLRRADAAFLPSGMPGRGYLQVGNENIELIQVAYTGENYPYAEVPEGGRPPKFYDMVVGLANELLEGGRPRTPWPPFLPTALTFADPLKEAYLDPEYRELVTWGGRTSALALNPYLQAWLEGRGRWHGVDWNNNALHAVVGLMDDPYHARQAPLVVDFTKGHAVVFGASGWGKTTFLRSLVLSLAATHSPDEFQAHILDLGGRQLAVLTDLPHVGSVIMPDEEGYVERIQQLLREISDLVDARKRLFAAVGASTLVEYNANHPDAMQPAVLIGVDNFGEFIDTFGGGTEGDDENSLLATFIALARQAKAYGIHFVVTANRLNVMSSKLYSLFTERYTLRLAGNDDYPGIVGKQIDDIDEVPGRGRTRVGREVLDFQVALAPGAIDAQGHVRGEAKQIRTIGQAMHAAVEAALTPYQRPIRIDALPKSSSYRQVLAELLGLPTDQPFLERLKEATAEVWTRNATAEHANWLRVTLGITSGNRKRTLAFEAKRDGVHGLIAGGTGSGKSELLMTLIVGLALSYSPEILNFVLVDYKGGGAFKPFERLPHCVDIVTNLNKAAVARMFTAINAEIRRRQKLNADTQTKDIVEYRRKGLHLSREPYPHLFIIIDEYAEMIDASPEYRDELESITRVGRAQGVNLILASQQPKGVTDQMRANIKLRLCLRVEQADTSRELLQRPDAALLPNGLPGRGYMQIGNESLELIQVSYTGEQQPDDRTPEVIWPGRASARENPTTGDIPRFFDAAVMLARELAGDKMAPKPWPAFLPRIFSLQSPVRDAQRDCAQILVPAVTDWLNGEAVELWPGISWSAGAMRPVVALLDNPAEAIQTPLQLDLSREHLVIFGDTGWGKTTFLRTLAISLVATHSPNELHLYALDLGGRSLRSLEGLPHMGAVIYADEEAYEERQWRLLERLTRMADERQQLLGESGVSSIYEFNARFPLRAVPVVLVLVNNFARLHESYETLVETLIVPLVRRSASLGIAFVVSANTPSNLSSRLYDLFGERMTFKQSNTERYMDIVGRGALDIDDIAGRGYVKRNKRPLLFQTALPVGIPDSETGRDPLQEADEIQLLAQNMQNHTRSAGFNWRARPEPVRILPKLAPLKELMTQVSPVDGQSIRAVLGQLGNLQPAVIDLRHMGPHFAIIGPPLSGKTTALYNWILSLTTCYGPQQVRLLLIDLQQRLSEYGGHHTLADLPHVIASVAEIEDVKALMPSLKTMCQELGKSDSRQELFIVVDNFDDFAEAADRDRGLAEELADLARRYGRDGLHFVVVSTPEGSSSDLKRRILSSNYGLGLQTDRSLESLRVLRTPAAVRDRQLPTGRGFIVKSGEPTLIQVASPYEGMMPNHAPVNPEDEMARQAMALDQWLESILTKYGTRRSTWVIRPKPDDTERAGVSREEDPAIQRMLVLLRRGMHAEIERLSQSIKSMMADDAMNQSLQHRERVRQTSEAISAVVLPYVAFGRLLQSTRLFLTDDGQVNANTLKPVVLARKTEDIANGLAQLRAGDAIQPQLTRDLAGVAESLPADTRPGWIREIKALAAATDELIMSTELQQLVQAILTNAHLDGGPHSHEQLAQYLHDLSAIGDQLVKIGRLPGMVSGPDGNGNDIIEDVHRKLTELSAEVDGMVTARLLQADLPQWNDGSTIRALLVDLWRNRRREMQEDTSLGEDPTALDDESLFMELEGAWPDDDLADQQNMS